jgi:hypothetical protein
LSKVIPFTIDLNLGGSLVERGGGVGFLAKFVFVPFGEIVIDFYY